MISFFKKYKHHFPVAALVFGLAWDSLTLGRPDELYGNLVLLSYLIIAGFCITLMARRELLQKESKIWLSLITQFSFGNLAGGLLVLYIGSATLVGNWPFLLIIVGLLIGNEIFKTRYERLHFNTIVYYLLIFLYSILIVPVLFRSVESWTFLVSAVLSLLIIGAFLYLLSFTAREIVIKSRVMLTRNIFMVLVVFGTLYYTNVIPPVPLAVRDIGIFHSVERIGGEYQVTYEKGSWYEFWRKSDSKINLNVTDTASCFSAIFAPTELETPVLHVWERFNKDSNMWEEKSRFNFPIAGGRVAGYRGYSEKTVDEGTWRCSVETKRGALLGRVKVIVSPENVKEFTTDTR